MKASCKPHFLQLGFFKGCGIEEGFGAEREKEREQEWDGFLWLLSRARSTAASTAEPIWVSLKTSFPRHGKAYLFKKVANVTVGETEERMMLTGLHTVADIFCVGCGSIVGWKYEIAHEKSQKYKEGKSVLERFKISGPDGSNYWVSHEAHVGGSDADDV